MNAAADAYLMWVNDFLTVQSFAAYMRVDESRAERIIATGRRAHVRRVRRRAHGVREGDGFDDAMKALRHKAHGKK